jgi:hypothetical protein
MGAMTLPTGFLKTCQCGKLMSKPDIRQDHTCSCGTVWAGFRKKETGSVANQQS